MGMTAKKGLSASYCHMVIRNPGVIVHCALKSDEQIRSVVKTSVFQRLFCKVR